MLYCSWILDKLYKFIAYPFQRKEAIGLSVQKNAETKRKLDWPVLVIPLVIIVSLCALLILFPDQSRGAINNVRDFITNTFGWYYILIGLFFFLAGLYIAFSKRGRIRLGSADKPKYSNFAWGSMVFTSTMAADILFFALHEWGYYYTSVPLDFADMTLAQKQLWASSYPLFHWSLIPWSFYIVPAAAYGYMFFVDRRSRQRLSEACRPLIGRHTDGALGKTMDMFSVFGLLAGTATTFSLSTPLITLSLNRVFGFPNNKFTVIGVLVVICVVYTIAVVFSFKGISYVAKLCVWFYAALLGLFLIGSNIIYTLETSVTAVGNIANNFFRMATWLDPLRLTAAEGSVMGFPQQWTVFYWAYWIAWCVATPFFIGRISEGRTLRQVVIGGLLAGVGSTALSFTVFGSFGLHLQVEGRIAAAEMLAAGAPASEVIIEVFSHLPLPKITMTVLVATMVLFYASTFDALAMVMSTYSYRGHDLREPGKGMKAYWSMIFVVLPIGLLFSEQAMTQLQTISIIAAFPISIILLVVLISFFRTSRQHLQ